MKMNYLSRILFLAIVLFVSASCSDDDDNFPSDAFKEIKDNAFREFCKQFDTNQDGVLSKNEAMAVEGISIVGYETKRKSVEGLELFKNLTYLSYWGEEVTTIDLSKNTSLESVNISGTQIKNIHFGNLSKLRILNIHSKVITE